MKNVMNTKTLTTVAGLLATSLLTGCLNYGENFAGDTGYLNVNNRGTADTSTKRFNEAQNAAGAKEDAILSDMHFHGSELTSLGECKLDLILKGTTAGDPVKIYLNVPHDTITDREAAVTAYLKKSGIADSNMVLAEGSNPNNTTPSAYNMNGLYKQDGSTYNGQAAADTGSAAAAPMGGAH